MPRDPRGKLPLALTLEFDDAGVLFDGLGELFHGAVDFKLHRIVGEHHAAIVGDVGKEPRVLRPLRLGEREQIDVVHADKRPLRHHGHCLKRLGKGLGRQRFGAEAVLVERARRPSGELSRQQAQIVLPQIRFLAAENIEILKFSVFEVCFQSLKALIRSLCRLFCHVSAL